MACSREGAAAGPPPFLELGNCTVAREVDNRTGSVSAKGSEACLVVLVEPNFHWRALSLD